MDRMLGGQVFPTGQLAGKSSMAERRGKYSGLLSEIRKEQTNLPPAIAFPAILTPKPPPPAGKRRDPAFIQKGVFLKKDSIHRATECLARRNDKTDFSDLMQALLEAWVQNQGK
jgi:hypothetical protein